MRCLCFLALTTALMQVTTGQIQQVRLAGGNATAGRVEVQVNGVWGTVCDDNWGDTDATVTCKNLGLTGGVAFNRAKYGEGTGPIFMDDVFCAGNENRLQDCDYVTGAGVNCQHSEDASVECQPAGAQPTPTPQPTTPPTGVTVPSNCQPGSGIVPSVQLYGNSSLPGVGFVQVRASNGTFGFVCDDGWDVNAAKVVCRELCFDISQTEPGMKKEFIVRVDSPVFALDDVRCVGNEAKLEDCTRADWFVHNCAAQEVAAVTCVQVTYPTPAPPSPVLQCRNGDLIALFNKSRDPNLEPKHLSLLNATQPCSFRTDDTGNFTSAIIPFDECGTKVEQNETHIIYSNVILMESTSREGAISRVNNYRIELTCEMPRNDTVNRDVQPLSETVTRRTEGNFVITMTIYQDQQFTTSVPTYPYQLNLGDWLNAAVELESIDSRLKLVVTDCVASPDLNDPNAPVQILLQDKCVPERSTMEIYPLSQVKVGLRLQSFIFVGYPLVLLQCNAIVCLTSEVTAECDRSCTNAKPTNGRRRRDVSGTIVNGQGMKEVYRVNTQPFVVVVPLNASSTPASATTTFKVTPRPTTTSTEKTTTSTPKPTTTTTTTTTASTSTTTVSTVSTTASTSTSRSPTVIAVRATATTTTTTPTTSTKPSTSSEPLRDSVTSDLGAASNDGDRGQNWLQQSGDALVASDNNNNSGTTVSLISLVVWTALLSISVLFNAAAV